jgi:hypothetical protein
MHKDKVRSHGAGVKGKAIIFRNEGIRENDKGTSQFPKFW